MAAKAKVYIAPDPGAAARDSRPVAEWTPSDVAAWFEAVEAESGTFRSSAGDDVEQAGNGGAPSLCAAAVLANGVNGAELLALGEGDDEHQDRVLERCGVQSFADAKRVNRAVRELLAAQQQPTLAPSGSTPGEQEQQAALDENERRASILEKQRKLSRRRASGFDLPDNASALAAPTKLPGKTTTELFTHGVVAAVLAFALGAAPIMHLFQTVEIDSETGYFPSKSTTLRRALGDWSLVPGQLAWVVIASVWFHCVIVALFGAGDAGGKAFAAFRRRTQERQGEADDGNSPTTDDTKARRSIAWTMWMDARFSVPFFLGFFIWLVSASPIVLLGIPETDYTARSKRGRLCMLVGQCVGIAVIAFAIARVSRGENPLFPATFARTMKRWLLAWMFLYLPLTLIGYVDRV